MNELQVDESDKQPSKEGVKKEAEDLGSQKEEGDGDQSENKIETSSNTEVSDSPPQEEPASGKDGN